jgi:tripartite-type tricarboxylate transporter receptor subunit TctC
VAFPPGVPQAAVSALRAAVERVNGDKEHAEEALRTMGFVPEWVTGPQLNKEVREALALSPEMRAFLADYVRRAVK